MRRVVFNQKGGVGKSTITCNLAALAAHAGQRTLVVDLDPQGNTSRYVLGETADGEHADAPGAAGFFESTLKFSMRPPKTADFIVPTPWQNLHVMPAGAALDELHGKLESRYKIYKLRDALQELDDDYDQVWIDTPPALNFYTRSALIAAQGCLIPFDCDDFSRRALYGLMEAVSEIQADHNAELVVEGIVVNQFQPRATLPQRTVQELVDEGLPVLQPYLGASVKIKESHELSRPMVHLDARHKLTLEFAALYEALTRPKTRAKRRG
ncbi:MAG: cobyric acid synthase [Leptothrix sp. (in: Bacteria)]|nr:cobyric acid synthase [Leptothrix sp. (in: b-proteobacteria)]